MNRAFCRNFIRYWLPVILWMGFNFWMSTEAFSAENTFSSIESFVRFFMLKLAPDDMELINICIRKAAHLTEYFILGFLLYVAFRGRSTRPWNWRWSLYAAMVVVLWAASDELHQSYVPSRTASIVDVSIDTMGGILAQLTAILWYRPDRIQGKPPY